MKTFYVGWTGAPWRVDLLPEPTAPSIYRDEAKIARVIEETRKPLIRRHTELRLSRVDSVTISTSPDSRLFVLGLATLPAYGIGIVVLLVWVIRRFRWVAIRSDATSLVVRIQGPDDRYEDFMDAVLDASDAADSGRSAQSE